MRMTVGVSASPSRLQFLFCQAANPDTREGASLILIAREKGPITGQHKGRQDCPRHFAPLSNHLDCKKTPSFLAQVYVSLGAAPIPISQNPLSICDQLAHHPLRQLFESSKLTLVA